MASSFCHPLLFSRVPQGERTKQDFVTLVIAFTQRDCENVPVLYFFPGLLEERKEVPRRMADKAANNSLNDATV